MKTLENTARFALQALQEAGADMAWVEVIRQETREFNVENGDFSLFRTLFDNSLSLTAFQGGRKGSLRLNRFDEESVRSAAAECLAVAASGMADEAWSLNPEAEQADFTWGAPEPELEAFFHRCRELKETLETDWPDILSDSMVFLHVGEESVYLNSNGSLFREKGGHYEVSLSFSGHRDGKSSSFFYSGFLTDDLSVPFLQRATLEEDLRSARNAVETRSVGDTFEGTVLLHPNCLSDFLGIAAGSFASDSCLIDGTSIWKDKLGAPVADSRLSVSVAPLDGRILGGERYTSEGHISQNYDFIENGVLRSFLLSRYGAAKTGLQRSANTDSCMVVSPGDTPLSELIAGIDRGLLVGRLSGGNPGAGGDFSGVAKNSFLIENGKITDAVSETMLAGNLAQLLQNVAGISRELVCDGVNVLPWAAFRGVTVSGG